MKQYFVAYEYESIKLADTFKDSCIRTAFGKSVDEDFDFIQSNLFNAIQETDPGSTKFVITSFNRL